MASDDTEMGGAGRAFPHTPASAVHLVRSDNPIARGRAFALIVQGYWKPVYLRIRRRHGRSNEAAKDLTQAFFARAFEKGVFEAFESERARASGARFRTFVRTCCDNFVLNELTAARALKRGGGELPLDLDFEGAEEDFLRAGKVIEPTDDRHFDQAWIRHLWRCGLDRLDLDLRAERHRVRRDLAHAYLFVDEEERPTYAELAEAHECKVTDVTNHLHAARKKLRSHLVTLLRELTANAEEFRLEAAELFGLVGDEVA